MNIKMCGQWSGYGAHGRHLRLGRRGCQWLLAFLLSVTAFLFTGCEDSGGSDPAGFIAIHLEPGFDPANIDYAADRWGPLQALVADADAYDIKLTLLFSPQFAEWVGTDAANVSRVKNWQSQGHEVGIHHHGPSHGVWDGYADATQYTAHADYQGSLDDLVALVEHISRGGVRTANVGTPSDAEAEWPEGVPFEADGGLAGMGDLISEPQSVTRGGQSVKSVRHAQYGTGISDVALEDIVAAIGTMEGGQVLGLVFHDQDYADNPAHFRELFQALKDSGLSMRALRSIL